MTTVDPMISASSRHKRLSRASSLSPTAAYLTAHSFSCASSSMATLSSGDIDCSIFMVMQRMLCQP